MRKNKFKTELGNIYINKPISKSAVIIIIISLLSLISSVLGKVENFKTTLFIVFSVFIVVVINVVVKIMKFIIKKIRNDKSERKYETKRLEWVYNVSEKIFYIFAPLALIALHPSVLILPPVIFSILVYMSIKNHIDKNKKEF